MSTPIGHTLSTVVLRVGHRYTSRCRCGLDVYGPTLPAMWAAHDMHLAAVKAMSKAGHPSRRRDQQ